MSMSASESAGASVKPEAATPVTNGVKPEEAASTSSVDLEKARKSFQDKAQTYLAEQGRPVVVPSFAKWFDMNEIHELEKQSFPDFFPQDSSNASIYRNADAYKHSRDFMINCYRLNPMEYLTVTAVRRNLAGDVTNIIRVHQFLEKWGLINYQIDPRTKPTVVGPQYTGHFQITLDTPKGLVPFIHENLTISNSSTSEDVEMKPEAEDPQSPPSSVDSEPIDLKTIPLNLEVRPNVYNDTKDNFKDNTNQYVCSVTGKDINEVRYYNLKSKGLPNNQSSTTNNATTISEECFEQGLFPSNFQSSNFVKLTKERDSENWSEQEVLLLLEGIEMHGSYDLINNASANQINTNSNGQWIKISDHVGTKTKEQCILKFIQLPIEDTYLNKLIDKKADVKVDKEYLIQEIANKVIEANEGSSILQRNSKAKINDINSDESNLIKQVSELTLEKVSIKLANLQALENNLIKIESKLNLERKQVAIERWLQYEKILKFKQSNTNTELSALLDDLLSPVSLHEIDSTTNKKTDETDSALEAANKSADKDLPISVVNPKTYQFWSG
ncbi:Chromatin structure-remodeling complex protein rsc8 [Yamadazyma tenuis]|uniref:SWIRM-domain-containing protein n=2 Tax=Candida tenuis (strain ATCC 10573 / BCRC 21748 / CBS 615 / JCM 9827 / NBRC 10315 / NRRL Y-1498 / VKM Y-70) TaxID=590646 RepID=G3B7V5_CANTC|nr:uncharacterized protein CANTEDRAFT_98851 [Yamadazyma tenuis ATCC 10573]EGV62605.1 hypothetical protein CANTEDRAFT_98851 [Yamadazyma tenuis ATCC 10573]WEJ92893.1 Chromatin structure-remodeling complex protein rsc8 [Yamadazyma tenuis]